MTHFILASGSTIRATILRNAGVDFEIEKPGVDEQAVKAARPGASGEALAVELAQEKALAVSRRRSELVLGADQVLRFDGELFDKVNSLGAARARLAALRGRTHELVGGVAVARDGEVLDTITVVSRLTMRAFSDQVLDGYLNVMGEELLTSVGCYQFENAGVQLFEKVEGDYFAILGLPLLETLAVLRRNGGVAD